MSSNNQKDANALTLGINAQLREMPTACAEPGAHQSRYYFHETGLAGIGAPA